MRSSVTRARDNGENYFERATEFLARKIRISGFLLSLVPGFGTLFVNGAQRKEVRSEPYAASNSANIDFRSLLSR